jgi:hypothetical protein
MNDRMTIARALGVRKRVGQISDDRIILPFVRGSAPLDLGAAGASHCPGAALAGSPPGGFRGQRDCAQFRAPLGGSSLALTLRDGYQNEMKVLKGDRHPVFDNDAIQRQSGGCAVV